MVRVSRDVNIHEYLEQVDNDLSERVGQSGRRRFLVINNNDRKAPLTLSRTRPLIINAYVRQNIQEISQFIQDNKDRLNNDDVEHIRKIMRDVRAQMKTEAHWYEKLLGFFGIELGGRSRVIQSEWEAVRDSLLAIKPQDNEGPVRPSVPPREEQRRREEPAAEENDTEKEDAQRREEEQKQAKEEAKREAERQRELEAKRKAEQEAKQAAAKREAERQQKELEAKREAERQQKELEAKRETERQQRELEAKREAERQQKELEAQCAQVQEAAANKENRLNQVRGKRTREESPPPAFKVQKTKFSNVWEELCRSPMRSPIKDDRKFSVSYHPGSDCAIFNDRQKPKDRRGYLDAEQILALLTDANGSDLASDLLRDMLNLDDGVKVTGFKPFNCNGWGGTQSRNYNLKLSNGQSYFLKFTNTEAKSIQEQTDSRLRKLLGTRADDSSFVFAVASKEIKHSRARRPLGLIIFPQVDGTPYYKAKNDVAAHYAVGKALGETHRKYLVQQGKLEEFYSSDCVLEDTIYHPDFQMSNIIISGNEAKFVDTESTCLASDYGQNTGAYDNLQELMSEAFDGDVHCKGAESLIEGYLSAFAAEHHGTIRDVVMNQLGSQTPSHSQ